MDQVTKIVIKGSSSDKAAPENAYTDTLTIQASGVTYVFAPVNETEQQSKLQWSYKSNTPTYAKAFDTIGRQMRYLATRVTTGKYADITPLTVTISIENSKSVKFTVYSHDIPAELIENIRKLVPRIERFPKSLKQFV